MTQQPQEKWEERIFMVMSDDGVCHAGKLIEPNVLYLRQTIVKAKEEERRNAETGILMAFNIAGWDEEKAIIEAKRILDSLTPNHLIGKR